MLRGEENEKFEFGVSFKSPLDIQAEIFTMQFHTHLEVTGEKGIVHRNFAVIAHVIYLGIELA